MNKKIRRHMIAFAIAGAVVTIASDVLAVIGMPATPVSVAGAARRTVRRNYYR